MKLDTKFHETLICSFLHENFMEGNTYRCKPVYPSKYTFEIVNLIIV